MASVADKRMVADEFLEWCRTQPDGRFELVAGELIAMAPERVAHVRRKAAVWRELDDSLQAAGSSCEALTDGATVRIDDETVYEPDALELTGVPALPAGEGSSLVGFMRGAPPAGRAVACSDFLHDRRVIMTRRWKFIPRGNLTATMFDLEEDPGERNQLDLNRYPIAERYCRVLLGRFPTSDARCSDTRCRDSNAAHVRRWSGGSVLA